MHGMGYAVNRKRLSGFDLKTKRMRSGRRVKMPERKSLWHLFDGFCFWVTIFCVVTLVPSWATAAIISGHVYDDQTGLPVSDTSVQVTEIGGVFQDPPLSYFSDTSGKVSFALETDSLAFEVIKAGYSTIQRKLDVGANSNEMADLRITPLGGILTLTPLQLSAPIDMESTLSVVGSISEPIEIRTTVISQQGINAPLPLGWSPLFAVDVSAESGTSLPPLKITTNNEHGITAADDSVFVFWDNNNFSWQAVGVPAISADGNTIDLSIAQMGHYVLAIPDVTPLKPPIPNQGESLQGVTFDFSPGDSIASVAFNPAFIVSGGQYRSMAETIVTTTVQVPSGFHIKTRFLEQYDLADATHLVAPPYYKDIALYEYPSDANRMTLTAFFPVTPRQTFPMGELIRGNVELSILDVLVYPNNTSASVMGPAGGELVFEDDLKIQFGSNVISLPTVVDARPLAGEENPLFENSDLTYAGGVDLRLSEENITGTRGVTISLPVFSGYADQTPVFIARHVPPYASSDWAVVATGRVANGYVILDTCAADKCLPGIEGSGQYAFFVPQAAFGFVTGTLKDDAGNPLAGAALRVEELPFTSASDSAGRYITVALQGGFTLSAETISGEFCAAYSDTINSAGEVKAVDLVLQQVPFEVVVVDPVDTQVRVSLKASVALTLSKPADKTTVNAGSVHLTYVAGSQLNTIQGALTVAGENDEIHFIPQTDLPDNTVFILELTDGIKDLAGNALTPFSSTFTTADILENDIVSPGAVMGMLPDENGDSTIMGGIGVAAPNSLVSITNTTTHATTSVTANSNGSFQAVIKMALTDVIQVSVADAFGNSTDIQVLSFVGQEGEFLVRPDHDNISSFNEIRAIIESGAVDEPIVAQIAPVQLGDVLPEVLNNPETEYLGGISVDLKGHVLSNEMKVSIPSPGGIIDDDVILVVKVININGTDRTTLVNIARLTADNRLETASPPFPGILEDGVYYFLKAIGAPGFVVVPVVVKAPEGAYIPTAWGWVYVEPGAGFAVIPVAAGMAYDIQLINATTGVVEDTVSGTAPDSGGIMTTEEILTDDETPPQVIGGSVLYEEGHDLQIGEKITIIFDEEMSADSFNQATLPISLANAPDAPLNGTYQLISNDKTVRFLPEVPIPLGVDITVDAKLGIKDLAGNELPQNIWNLRYFKPFVIATIDRPVRDMDILQSEGKPPYLMFLETIGEESHLVAVDISDAAAVDQPEKATEAYSWYSGFGFNSLKVARGIGPITGKDGTIYGSGDEGGDFAFVGYNLMGETLNTEYLQKSYPGHSLLHVFNIDDPLDAKSVNLHILSVSPTEQWVTPPAIGQAFESLGLPVTDQIEIENILASTFGGSDSFPGTWVYPRDIEVLYRKNTGEENLNFAYVSNISFGNKDEDADYMVGIQGKDVSKSDGSYSLLPGGNFPDLPIDMSFVSTPLDLKEHFFGLAVLENEPLTILAIDAERKKLLHLTSDLQVIWETTVPNLSYGVTAISGYQIDRDSDGRTGEAEDNDQDALSSEDETYDLAVVGCFDSIRVYIVRDYVSDTPLLAKINLPGGSSGFISVDKEKKLAYVPDKNIGLIILDFALNSSNQTELIDSDGNGQDDRILGRVSTNGGIKTELVADKDGRKVVYLEDYLNDIDVVQVGCSSDEINVVALANGKNREVLWIEDSVVFTANGCNLSNNPSLAYHWDFGDNSSSTDYIPTHSYSEIGEYEVKLTVTCDQCSQQLYSDTVNVSVVEMGIVTDYNHDRKIDDEDRRMSLDGEVFHFWINDDYDQGDSVSGIDIPGSFYANYNTVIKKDGLTYGVVDGQRDQIDFFPILVDIKSYLEKVKDLKKVEVRIGHEHEKVNFVYTNLRLSEACSYLTNSEIAKNLASAETIHISKEGVLLENDFLRSIKEQDKGVLLLEGRGKTTAPLVVQIYYDGKKEVTLLQAIAIDDVEDMFGYKSLITDGGGAANLIDRLDININSGRTSKNFLFVHGFNVNEEQGRGWMAEFFKRLYWSGSLANFYGISWFGYESYIRGFYMPEGFYQDNVINAFESGRALADFTNQLEGKVNIAAHSLGNIVVSTAINDYGSNIDNYFLLNAAVALEAYDADPKLKSASMWNLEWVGYDFRLWASEWYTHFQNEDKRKMLTWRNRFSNVSTPVKPDFNAYNFYSSGEDVLAEQAGKVNPFPIIFGGTNSWVIQEKLKGRMQEEIVSSTFGGWGFNRHYDINNDRRLPDQTNSITQEELMVEPFFRAIPDERPGPLIDKLYDPLEGSEFAEKNRGMLLAKMIPALTLPAGANKIPIFGERNYDINILFQNGWPEERNNDRCWRHGDVKTIAYVYVYKVFDKIVEIGKLKEID